MFQILIVKMSGYIWFKFAQYEICGLPDHLSFYQMSEHNIVSEPYVNIPIVILSNVIA